jgi:hypothetical protein
MPYVCWTCEFFDADGAHAAGCPSCGGRMSFTMLGPTSTATATATLAPQAKTAWRDPYAHGYEVLEASAACRYAQLCAGISTYFFVYRWGPRLLTLLAGGDLITKKVPPDKVAVLVVAILIANCIAAFSGGFAAGFWARNWLMQGLGVLLGVLTIPVVSSFFSPPAHMLMYGITLAASGTLALAGAYAGHLIVPPTRIPTS